MYMCVKRDADEIRTSYVNACCAFPMRSTSRIAMSFLECNREIHSSFVILKYKCQIIKDISVLFG